MQNPTKPPPDMKFFPRNLTARADYLVRGNPVVSRPESGADNSHPGLEFDQRNLDRGFFPGLLFDFQFGVGARLVDVQSPWLEKEREKDNQNSLAVKDAEFFLWYVHGKFGEQPGTLTPADLYGIDGYEVLRKVHDLEPGPLAIVVGLHPEKLDLKNGAAWLKAAMLLKEKVKLLEDDALGQQLETFRADDGSLQFALLTGHRADYLNGDGVIDLQTVEPGALTRSLCSPWQWDFADCGCYYWAASRPDIVTSADGKQQGLNFLRIRGEDAPPAPDPLTWRTWMDQTRIMSQPQMILGWESLPLVIGDREARSYEHKATAIQDPWNRATIIEQLRHLAAVEHALCIKFLYAHYSVNAPDDGSDPKLSTVAQEVFKIAIDEMHHFRWVNEALIMLGQQAVLSRATKSSKPPGGSRVRQHQVKLVLEALTHAALKRFIEVERPSQKVAADEVAGLYTHILASLECHPDRHTEYGEEVRVRLQEVVKLIIDEGHDHWLRAERVQELLQGYDPKTYLRYEGAPCRQPPDCDAGRLQILGDHYYRLMLEILGKAFRPPRDAQAEMIRQARRVMHNLHEVGHLLGGYKQGLLFTMPRKPGTLSHAEVSRLFGTVLRHLAPLRTSGSDHLTDIASRHGQTASELHYFFADAAAGDNGL